MARPSMPSTSQNVSYASDTLLYTRPTRRAWPRRDTPESEDGATTERHPVKRFIAALPIDDRAAIAAAMKDIQIHGNVSAHHLRGDIYEVRAYASKRQYRILYSTEGRSDQVLLSIHAIIKTTRAVPGGDIDLAERRHRDWRSRGRHSRDCAIDTVDSMPYSA